MTPAVAGIGDPDLAPGLVLEKGSNPMATVIVFPTKKQPSSSTPYTVTSDDAWLCLTEQDRGLLQFRPGMERLPARGQRVIFRDGLRELHLEVLGQVEAGKMPSREARRRIEFCPRFLVRMVDPADEGRAIAEVLELRKRAA